MSYRYRNAALVVHLKYSAILIICLRLHDVAGKLISSKNSIAICCHHYCACKCVCCHHKADLLIPPGFPVPFFPHVVLKSGARVCTCEFEGGVKEMVHKTGSAIESGVL